MKTKAHIIRELLLHTSRCFPHTEEEEILVDAINNYDRGELEKLTIKELLFKTQQIREIPTEEKEEEYTSLIKRMGSEY